MSLKYLINPQKANQKQVLIIQVYLIHTCLAWMLPGQFSGHFNSCCVGPGNTQAKVNPANCLCLSQARHLDISSAKNSIFIKIISSLIIPYSNCLESEMFTLNLWSDKLLIEIKVNNYYSNTTFSTPFLFDFQYYNYYSSENFFFLSFCSKTY